MIANGVVRPLAQLLVGARKALDAGGECGRGGVGRGARAAPAAAAGGRAQGAGRGGAGEPPGRRVAGWLLEPWAWPGRPGAGTGVRAEPPPESSCHSTPHLPCLPLPRLPPRPPPGAQVTRGTLRCRRAPPRPGPSPTCSRRVVRRRNASQKCQGSRPACAPLCTPRAAPGGPRPSLPGPAAAPARLPAALHRLASRPCTQLPPPPGAWPPLPPDAWPPLQGTEQRWARVLDPTNQPLKARPSTTGLQGAGREVGEAVGVEGAPEAVVRLVAEAPGHLATEAAWVLAYITGGRADA